MIHLGKKWGRRYDNTIGIMKLFMRYYIPFKIKEGITFKNWFECGEFLKDQRMYLVDGFVPEYHDVIYDIGSQYGDWSLLWAKKYGARVYAFEALPMNYIKLVKNMDANDFGDGTMFNDIHVYNIIVGDGKDTGMTIRGDMASIDENMSGVQTVSMDSFILSEGIVFPDIMKIDVEGFEYKVLIGSMRLLATARPKVIIETHSTDLRNKCHDLLTNLGYELKVEGKPRKGIGWMDQVVNLFYAPLGE